MKKINHYIESVKVIKVVSVILKITALIVVTMPSYYEISLYWIVLAIIILIISDVWLGTRISAIEYKTKHFESGDDGAGIKAGKKFYFDC